MRFLAWIWSFRLLNSHASKMLPCLIAKTLSSTNWWTHFAALTGYRQSGKYWMKRLNPHLMMNLKKKKTNKVSFDSSLVSLWFHLSPLWFHFWVKPFETKWNRIIFINCCQISPIILIRNHRAFIYLMCFKIIPDNASSSTLQNLKGWLYYVYTF